MVPLVVPGGAFTPLAEVRFRLLWLGRAASSAGDVLVPVALAFAVLGLHDSPLALATVLATFVLARVAFSLVGGVVADRIPRRTVLLVCDGVRAATETFTAAMLFTHHMTLPLFVATAAIFGAASAFFGPASTALIPQTVGKGNLQAANALIGMTQNVLNVFGPALSGALIAASGTTAWVFVIDAVTFVASAGFLLRLRVDESVRAPHTRFVDELRTGYREVRSRAWVSSALIAFSISNACIAAFLVLGPVVIRHHGGAGRWGIIAACGALGAAVGAYTSSRSQHAHPLAVAFGLSTLIALPLAALARPLPLPLVDLAFAFGMGSMAYGNVLWETMLQLRIPGVVLARVRSYDQLASFVFMPVGYLLFGALAEGVGTESTLYVTAAVAAVANLVVAAIPSIRALTAEEPAATPAPAQAA